MARLKVSECSVPVSLVSSVCGPVIYLFLLRNAKKKPKVDIVKVGMPQVYQMGNPTESSPAKRCTVTSDSESCSSCPFRLAYLGSSRPAPQMPGIDKKFQ